MVVSESKYKNVFKCTMPRLRLRTLKTKKMTFSFKKQKK